MHETTHQLDKLSFTIYVPDEGLDQDLKQMIISYTQSDISNPKDYTWSATVADNSHFLHKGLIYLKRDKMSALI